jgi:hypothetical protein
MAEEVKIDRKEIKELEKFIIKQIEEIVFGTNRPSGVQKVSGSKYDKSQKRMIAIRQGGLKIEDKTGKLRRSIKRNKSFIKQGRNGLEINIKNLPPYWKYLDDERIEDYNWYLTTAIFEDGVISKKIKEVIAGAYKNYVINIFKE